MDKFILVIMVLTLVLFAAGITTCTVGSFNDETVTAQVNKKESVTEGKSHTYLIFTDGEVLQNDDNFLRGKFDASDFYGRIETGKTYKFVVVGWRVPFLSMYRNIIKMEEVK